MSSGHSSRTLFKSPPIPPFDMTTASAFAIKDSPVSVVSPLTPQTLIAVYCHFRTDRVPHRFRHFLVMT